MIKVDMDNGKRYAFDKYADYSVDGKYFVVESSTGAWIGCFAVEHMIGFFVEKDEEVLR